LGEILFSEYLSLHRVAKLSKVGNPCDHGSNISCATIPSILKKSLYIETPAEFVFNKFYSNHKLANFSKYGNPITHESEMSRSTLTLIFTAVPVH
jgi:hypothetical protein